MRPMTPLELAVRTMPKRKKFRKAARIKFPKIIEFKFRQAMMEVVEKMRQVVMNIVVPELPGMAKPRNDSFRLDMTDAEKLADLMRSVRLGLESQVSEAQMTELVTDIGNEISGYNRMQIHQVFRSVLGIDLLSSEPNITEVLSGFVRENVSLIKSVEAQYLGEIEQTVLRGIRTGLRHEAIAKQIVGESEAGFISRFGKAESRAELIARDQTGKFYGQLTELRQKSAGVADYIWRTALDERVRPEHADREGERFSWSDPPSGGHPGEDINCRCYAEPVIELEDA